MPSIPHRQLSSRLRVAPLLVALGAMAASTSAALALERKAYDGAAFAAAQQAGKSVVVQVTAPWCPTCKAQYKVIDDLAGKPEFGAVTVLEVDFDSQKDVLKQFKASQQSTLIGFAMGKETGRLVGETAPAPIMTLFSGTLASAAPSKSAQ